MQTVQLLYMEADTAPVRVLAERLKAHGLSIRLNLVAAGYKLPAVSSDDAHLYYVSSACLEDPAMLDAMDSSRNHDNHFAIVGEPKIPIGLEGYIFDFREAGVDSRILRSRHDTLCELLVNRRYKNDKSYYFHTDVTLSEKTRRQNIDINAQPVSSLAATIMSIIVFIPVMRLSYSSMQIAYSMSPYFIYMTSIFILLFFSAPSALMLLTQNLWAFGGRDIVYRPFSTKRYIRIFIQRTILVSFCFILYNVTIYHDIFEIIARKSASSATFIKDIGYVNAQILLWICEFIVFSIVSSIFVAFYRAFMSAQWHFTRNKVAVIELKSLANIMRHS